MTHQHKYYLKNKEKMIKTATLWNRENRERHNEIVRKSDLKSKAKYGVKRITLENIRKLKREGLTSSEVAERTKRPLEFINSIYLKI